ncbi:MAG TPA: M23 family metallopeptidase [Acidimicrobiales bacterium]|nr:M23 family metallopeptidase [Acidimicrobiales bacterium]
MTTLTPALRRMRARLITVVAVIVLMPTLILTTLLLDDHSAGAQEAQEARDSVTRIASRVLTLPEVAAPNPARIETAPTFACPAPGAEFIDSWGFSRSGGRRHQGVDMMAPHGSPVLAPQDGWVREHRSSLGGLSYYLTTPDGTEYFGGHMQSFIADGILDPFGWVTAGTLIGTVGSSGNASSSGPHLHWEVRTPDGTSVNPYPYASIFCA